MSEFLFAAALLMRYIADEGCRNSTGFSVALMLATVPMANAYPCTLHSNTKNPDFLIKRRVSFSATNKAAQYHFKMHDENSLQCVLPNNQIKFLGLDCVQQVANWRPPINYWREMMRTSIKLLGFTLVLGSATAMAANSVMHNSSSSMSSATSSAMKGAMTKEADNTDLNTRDKSGNTLTPQNQSNSESDLKVLAAVRSAIVDDDNLSTAAHNVKVMVAKGAVTLRGPVKNANEKARVEELTRNVAGVVNIDNRLDIDTN
ncbi:MAG: BON domain-containing protein [Cellvibrio sp.]|uniref:BON domain-containing protein n=1 Tax=Cellvibrio sp. TaxID=1965322 RepID=UPI00271AB430|nr:BON domain-containing protein [Cellvibrio sp.]